MNKSVIIAAGVTIAYIVFAAWLWVCPIKKHCGSQAQAATINNVEEEILEEEMMVEETSLANSFDIIQGDEVVKSFDGKIGFLSGSDEPMLGFDKSALQDWVKEYMGNAGDEEKIMITAMYAAGEDANASMEMSLNRAANFADLLRESGVSEEQISLVSREVSQDEWSGSDTLYDLLAMEILGAEEDMEAEIEDASEELAANLEDEKTAAKEDLAREKAAEEAARLAEEKAAKKKAKEEAAAAEELARMEAEKEAAEAKKTAAKALKEKMAAEAAAKEASSRQKNTSLSRSAGPDQVPKNEKLYDDFPYHTVYYNLNDTKIKDVTDHLRFFEKLAIYMAKSPESKIKINGHTDFSGIELYNENLGMERAQSLREHLLTAGVEESRISIKSYGETRPKAFNSSEKGRALNRRAEIIIE